MITVYLHGVSVLSDLILDEDWPASVYIQNEVELRTWVEPEPEFDFNFGVPPDYKTAADIEIENSRKLPKLESSDDEPVDTSSIRYQYRKRPKNKRISKPKCVIRQEPPKEEIEDEPMDDSDFKPSVDHQSQVAEANEAAREVKQEPMDEFENYPPVGYRSHGTEADKAACVVKQEPLDDPENNPSSAVEEGTPVDWVRDYLSQVTKTGKSSMPWNDVRPAFLKYLEIEVRERIRRYRIDNVKASNLTEDAEIVRTYHFVYKKIKSFEDFPSTFRRLCEILTYPPRCYAKLQKFMHALRTVVEVESTVPLCPQQKSKSRKVKEEDAEDEAFFFDDSKFAKLRVSEPKREYDSDSDADYDSDVSTRDAWKPKRRSFKHKRSHHQRRDDSSPEDACENSNRKKPFRCRKSAMSDLTNRR